MARLSGRRGFRPFDPDRAPHRALIRELVTANLPPLHRRIRGAMATELARRLVLQEPSPVPLVELDRAGQLALLVRRTMPVIEELEAEEQQSIRAFADFSFLFSQLDDDVDRRRLMAEYLTQTASGARALRGDLRALDRHLGFDALRERNAAEVLTASASVELALLFAGEAIASLAKAGDASVDQVAALIAADLPTFLATRLEHALRWQVRLAAGGALAALGEAARGLGCVVSDATVADAAARVADSRDEHPFIQGHALDAVLLLDRARGQDLLVDRLLTRRDPGVRDFLLRKLAVTAAVRRLGVADGERLLSLIVGSRDPSEHVRMGVAEAVGRLGVKAALRLLPALAGLDPALPEASAKVRATAVITARGLVGASLDVGRRQDARDVSAMLTDALARDQHPFSLQVACEEVAALAAELGTRGEQGLLDELAPRWLRALARLVAGDATPPRAAEAAAAMAEAIERERDPRRRALTATLASAVAATRPRGRGALRFDDLDPEVAAAANDRDLLARVLADLTRRDWGLSLRVTPTRLVFWRGDRFRRRLWRIIHELRNPVPNKRQAWLHTVGRVYPGELRAHPGLLDEATATTVPGERVTVDSEGSWCRHLPMVDDLLDLPVASGAPVRVASSHGVATLISPPSRWRRLKNRLAVSWRYKVFVALRLASLRAVEPRERRRYLETVERELGVQVMFAPHPHLAHAGVAPPGVANLFPAATPAADAELDLAAGRSATALPGNPTR